MGSITVPSQDQDLDILIIGGGLSGCYALHALRQLRPAPTIKLVEAAADFGGTWYYNRYPGARVDSEWPIYQFSIPEVWNTWRYTERFPDGSQIRAYVKHMDNVLDLRRDAYFNTVVSRVDWDDNAKKWKTQTVDGKNFTSHHIVVCSGGSYKRNLPDIKGLDLFKGTLLHSAAFPHEGIDVAGKRVGLIGHGATAVQIVQEIAKQDCQLVNFIRTPNPAIPLRQRSISKEEEEKRKPEFEDFFKSLRETRGGFPNHPPPVKFKDITNEQRNAILEKAWAKGGFAYILESFVEQLADKESNTYVYNFWAEKTRARMKDPEKRDIVAPVPQQHFFATKRAALEQDYYECLDRPNVKVISLKKTSIQEVTETGILMDDGTHHDLDVLICATGFDALNGSQKAAGLHDKHGTSLREKWSKGTHTYLGLTIPDLPNLFMVYGPQGPTALGNAPALIETAVDWIVRAIQKMYDEGIETVEPRAEVASKWRQNIQDVNDTLFVSKENSWWMGANIPGKFREQLNYVEGLPKYSAAIEDALDGWKGFDLGMKDGRVVSS